MIEPSSGADQSAALAVESQLQATLSQTQTWMTMIDNPASSERPQPLALGRVGVEGPGWLAFVERSQQVFARQASLSVRKDGYIVNEHGALLLGYAAMNQGAIAPIRIPMPDAAGDVTVDEAGSISIHARPARAAREHATPVGRVAIALPSYPQGSAGVPPGDWQQSAVNGVRYLPAGVAHVGTIKHNPSVIPSEAVRANLRALWDAIGRGELQVALTQSKDLLERTALDIVR